MNLVFDLDDTIANSQHRVQKYLWNVDTGERIENPDWDAFFEQCHLDTLLPAGVLARHHLESGHDVRIWTARCASVRNKTVKWLQDNDIWLRHASHLRMRPINNRIDDDLLKLSWLKEEEKLGFRPDIIFEDRKRLVDMYRDNGYTVFQVDYGDF